MKRKILALIMICVLVASCFTGCSVSDIFGGKEAEELLSETDEKIISEELTVDLATQKIEDSSQNDAVEIKPAEETKENESEVKETDTEEEASEESPQDTMAEEKNNAPEFAVTDMQGTKYAKQNCNVRSGPGTDYDKIGSLKKNDEVAITGKTENNWYRINFNNAEAFVSASLIVDEKVTETANASQPSSDGNSNSGNDSGEGSSENQGEDDDDSLWAGTGFVFPPENTCFVDERALTYVNEYRRAEGVEEVRWASELEEDCMARARAQKDNGKMDHSIGGGPQHGENLCRFFAQEGTDTAKPSVQYYFSYDFSPSHYYLMVSPSYNSVCFATCYDDEGCAYNVLWMARL